MKYRQHIENGRFNVDSINMILSFIEDGGQYNHAEWKEVLRIAYNTASFYYFSIPLSYIKDIVNSFLEPEKLDLNILKDLVKAHINGSEVGTNESFEVLKDLHNAASFYFNQVSAVNRAARMGGIKGFKQGSGN